MNLKDLSSIVGQLEITVTDASGRVKEQRTVPNLVVTGGKEFIAARMTGAPTAMSHMALGSGTVAPVVGNTTLGTELGRVALTSATTSGAVATYSASFGPGVATGAVTEAGIFNAATAGTMLNRSTFGVVNKDAGDTMQINWTVTIQ